MKYVPLYLDLSQTKALRRVIGRNIPAAPEKDRPLLHTIYDNLEKVQERHEKNLQSTTGDLFNGQKDT